MPDAPTPTEVVETLGHHPALDELAALVRRAALSAAAARRYGFCSRHAGPSDEPVALPEEYTRPDADTAYGNVVEVLERGVTTPAEGALVSTLLALSAAHEPEAEIEEQAFVAHVTWLAAHTPCDALAALDATVGESAAVYRTLARIAVEPADVASDFGRTEALVAAAALGASHTAAAARERSDAMPRAKDPAVHALLGYGGLGEAPLDGELVPAPRGPLLTAALAVTLLLFVIELGRLLGRLAFAYRRPATFRLTERGLELTHRVELLGKVLRQRSTLIPFGNIARVTREEKYARAGLYAGLAALVLGTYFGTGLFVNGMRVPGGSGSLFGLAAAFVVAGLLLDFVLAGAEDTFRGQCRLIVVPHRGRALCLGRVDPSRADAMLSFVTEVARGTATIPPPAPAPA